ncbi:hypothetical protein N2152v2_001108 [Parachlorella kessleri]
MHRAGCRAGFGLSAAAPIKPLYQRRVQWQDHATLLAAVQADHPVTAAYFLPEANPRAPKLLVLGDQAGTLHVLATDGALLGSFPTGSNGAVTAVASYRLARNATLLLTGHEAGEVRLFQIQAPDRALDLEEGESLNVPVDVQLLAVLPPEQLLCGEVWPGNVGADSGSSSGVGDGFADQEPFCTAIVQLGTAGGRGGRGPAGLVTAASATGAVAVLRLEGRQQFDAVRVVQRVQAGPSLLAARAQQATLTLLGSLGISALPASSGPLGSSSGASSVSDGGQSPQPQWSTCGGLNGSALLAGAFLEPQAHAAFAVTDTGRLVALALAGHGGRKGCQVRSSVKLPALLGFEGRTSQPPPPLSLSLLKGYLLMSTSSHLAVYNLTDGLSRRPPRLVLAQELSHVAQEFLPASAGEASSTNGAALSRSAANAWRSTEEVEEVDSRHGSSAGSASAQEPESAGVCEASSGNAGGGAGPSHVVVDSTADRRADTRAPAGAGSTCSSASGSSNGDAIDQVVLQQKRRQLQQQQGGQQVQQQLPLVASCGGDLVALAFGGGVLAVYSSRLPQKAKPPPPAGAAVMQFLQPMAIVGVAGIVLYRARNKREAMAGLGGRSGPTGRGGGRDSLGEFERLLRGQSAGRRGAFGRFEADSGAEEDLGPQVPSMRQGQLHGRRGLGESQSAAARPAFKTAGGRSGTAAGAEGPLRVGSRREQRGVGSRTAASPTGAALSGASQRRPGRGTERVAAAAAAAAAREAVAALAVGRGGRSGAQQPSREAQDARQAPPPATLSDEDELNAEHAPAAAASAADGPKMVRQTVVDYAPLPTGPSNGLSGPEGALLVESGFGSELDDSSEEEGEDEVDWDTTQLLAGAGSASDGSGAAELSELRRHYDLHE